jgi:hypothetical protein
LLTVHSIINIIGTAYYVATVDTLIKDKIISLNVASDEVSALDNGNLSGIEIYGTDGLGFIKTNEDATKFYIKAPIGQQNYISTLDLNNNLSISGNTLLIGNLNVLSKNKFCQYIFDKYFEVSIETSTKIIDLVKILVKKQILYKSNLSRGILLIYNNWNDVSLDYNNPNKKMKELLTCLKNMGITKFLENLLKTYKIEYEV